MHLYLIDTGIKQDSQEEIYSEGIYRQQHPCVLLFWLPRFYIFRPQV